MFSRSTLTCAYHRSTKPSTTWRAYAVSKRSISSTSHTDETISIPVGGNGTVDLKISRPTQPVKNNNVLVYLPPGPILESSRRDSQIFDSKTLRDTFPDTTIVDLEYRISLRNKPTSARSTKSPRTRNNDKDKDTDSKAPPASDHRFPTPIHDVFAAWDYITDSLQLYNHDIIDGKKIYFRPRICLVGSHIGGALALSLALTNPNSIFAVTVVDCLGDWTGIDELVGVRDGEVEKRDGKKSRNIRREKISERERIRLAAKELLRLRGRLFRSHSGYFDAFASPVLFLRAPGRDTPVENGDVGIGGGGEKGLVMRYGEEADEVGVIVDDVDVEVGVGATAGTVVDTRQAFGPYDDDWQARGYDVVHGDGMVRDGKGEGVVGVSDTSSTDGVVTEIQQESSATTVSDVSSTTDTSPASSRSADQDSAGTPTTPTQSPPETPTPTPSTSLSSSAPPSTPSPPRRRKVLRRWPPTAHPEDVLLPYINLYTTNPSSQSPSPSLPPSPSTSPTPNDPDQDQDQDHHQPIDITPITSLQAQELQELLRKACFWGREKSFAEERVVMTRLGVERDADGESSNGVDVGVGVGREERDREREREQVVNWLQARFDEDS